MDLAEFAVIRPLGAADRARVVTIPDRLVVPGFMPQVGFPTTETYTADHLPQGFGDPAWDPLEAFEDAGTASVVAILHYLVRTVSYELAAADDRLDGADLNRLVSARIESIRAARPEGGSPFEPKPAPVEDPSSSGDAPLGDDQNDGDGNPVGEGPPPRPATGDMSHLSRLFTIGLILIRKHLHSALGASDDPSPIHPPAGEETPAETQYTTVSALDYHRASLLTRLALVANLLIVHFQRPKTLTPEEVTGLLRTSVLVFDPGTRGTLYPDFKVDLVRQATARDHVVVRREWAGYLAGEVASIRNVMAGESYTQREKTVREDETTTTAETDIRERTDTTSEMKLTSELSETVSTELGLTITGRVEGSADFNYPMVTARVAGSVDATLNSKKATETSNKIAREAVARATSRVDSRTRQSRVNRNLTRNTEGHSYELTNNDTAHLHGIYRWVDRVDTYQLFTFTNRLQLEFQLPEPAEFYRWRTGRRAATESAVDKPPAWSLTAADDITVENLVELASTYHATNLPAGPDPEVRVTQTLRVAPTTISPGNEQQWNAPTAAAELDIVIPPDYETATVDFSGHGYPLFGKWYSSAQKAVDALASTFAAVAVGGKTFTFWNAGQGPKTVPDTGTPSTPAEFVAHSLVPDVAADKLPYGFLALPIGKQPDTWPPQPRRVELPGAETSLKVAVATRGVAECVITVIVTCVPTATATHTWQLRVYDALFNAWSQWKNDYETQQTRRELLGATGASDAGSSARNEQTIREELKRLTIAWLLDDAHFVGKPALQDPPAQPSAQPTEDFQNTDIDQAIVDAPTIQFLEQALDWPNIAYGFYPYYWAARAKWEELSQITADDPNFERFLRSGSTRVIVPARDGFEEAVRNWLLTGIPFLNGQLPNPAATDPHHNLYVGLDTEIRELTAPPSGGRAGDTWQSRMTTTMLYLDPETDLPIINETHMLPAPAGVEYQPTAYIKWPEPAPDPEPQPETEPEPHPDHNPT